MQGSIIVFAPEPGTPINYYWDGAAQIPMDSSTDVAGAKFYSALPDARADAAELRIRYPNQELAIVSTTLTTTIHITAAPQVLPPAPPVSSAPPTSSAPPATAP